MFVLSFKVTETIRERDQTIGKVVKEDKARAGDRDFDGLVSIDRDAFHILI